MSVVLQSELLMGKLYCGICYKELKGKQNAGTQKSPLCKKHFEQSFEICSHCGKVRAKSDMNYRADDVKRDYPVCNYCKHDYDL